MAGHHAVSADPHDNRCHETKAPYRRRYARHGGIILARVLLPWPERVERHPVRANVELWHAFGAAHGMLERRNGGGHAFSCSKRCHGQQ